MSGASLSFSPSVKTVPAGSTFTVVVKVSSPDQAMNAASGDVSFPSDALQVVSVSKANSIINLWVREPSFSNAASDGSGSIAGTGNVHFEGITLNPGYIGNGGTIIQITFRATGSVGDTASLAFSSASVLANDGQGTPMLDSTGSAKITLAQAAAPVVAPGTEVQTTTQSSTPIATPTTPTSTSLRPRVITIVEPIGGDQPLFLAWTLITLLAAAWLTGIVLLVLYMVGRPRHSRTRAELQGDLKRIKKELDHMEKDL